MTGPERRLARRVRRGAEVQGPAGLRSGGALAEPGSSEPALSWYLPCQMFSTARGGFRSFSVPLNLEHFFIALHSVSLNHFNRTEFTVDIFADPKVASCRTCVMGTFGRPWGILPGRSVFRYGLLPAKWIFVLVGNLYPFQDFANLNRYSFGNRFISFQA